MWQKNTKSGVHEARVVRGPNHGQFEYDLMYTIYRSVDLNQFASYLPSSAPQRNNMKEKQHQQKHQVSNTCNITNKNCRPPGMETESLPLFPLFFFCRSQVTLFSKKLVLPCKEMSSIQSKGFEEPKSLPWKNRLGGAPTVISYTPPKINIELEMMVWKMMFIF